MTFINFEENTFYVSLEKCSLGFFFEQNLNRIKSLFFEPPYMKFRWIHTIDFLTDDDFFQKSEVENWNWSQHGVDQNHPSPEIAYSLRNFNTQN
jgi:hypothetical protein